MVSLIRAIFPKRKDSAAKDDDSWNSRDRFTRSSKLDTEEKTTTIEGGGRVAGAGDEEVGEGKTIADLLLEKAKSNLRCILGRS